MFSENVFELIFTFPAHLKLAFWVNSALQSDIKKKNIFLCWTKEKKKLLTMQASQSINFILWRTNEICSSHWPSISEAVSASLIQLSPEVLRTKRCDHFCARKKKQRENRGGRVSSELHMASVVLFGVKCEQHKSNLRVGNKKTLTNGSGKPRKQRFCFVFCFPFSVLILNHQCWTTKESWGGKLKRNNALCAQ